MNVIVIEETEEVKGQGLESEVVEKRMMAEPIVKVWARCQYSRKRKEQG